MSDPQFPPQPPSGYEPPDHEPIPQEPARAAEPPKGRSTLRTGALFGVAGLVVGGVLGAAIGSGVTTAEPAAPLTPAPAPTVTVTMTKTKTVTKTVAPTLTPEPSPEPTSTVIDKLVSGDYQKLDAREFKKLAKDPEAHSGNLYVIYGEVTQFDAATGVDVFRAHTGPKKLKVENGYTNFEQNTMLTGASELLADVVEGDVFKAKVMSLGAYNYETQLGGTTTVPLFMITEIKVYDSTA